MTPAELAKNIWDDRAREKHCTMLFEAISAALQSVTLSDGTQDALCVYEALAIQIAQLTAGLDRAAADSTMGFIISRADDYRPEFIQAGKGAHHFIEDLN